MALPNSQPPEEKKNAPERAGLNETHEDLYALRLSAKTRQKLEKQKRELKRAQSKASRTYRKTERKVEKKWKKTMGTPEAKKVKGGLESLKESVSEGIGKIKDIINDPDARKEALTAIGAIAAILIFGKNEEIEEREENEKATNSAMKELESNGEVEEYDPPTEPIDTADGEVADNYQFIAIQLKAAMNKRNTGELNEMGIEIPESAKKLNALSMFTQGIPGEYGKFRNRITEKLQPNAKEEDKVKNCVAILARSALGKYQILPKHHFHHLDNYPGLNARWSSGRPEEKMLIIYKYLRSESMQDFVNLQILKGLKNEYEGIPQAMAAAYYSGSKAGMEVMKMQKEINNGNAVETPEWIKRKQEQGGATFGSIYFYSNKAAQYYQKMNNGKKSVDNLNDLKTFQKAIAKKETGYLKGKRAKRKVI